MNIVHVSVTTLPVTHRYGGAVQRRVMETAKEQVHRGHKVVVYSPGPAGTGPQEDIVPVRFITCRSKLPARHIEFQLRSVADLLHSKARVDAIYFHGQPEGAWLSSAITGKKYLWYDEYHFRRSKAYNLAWLYRHFLMKFDRLLAVSEYCREESSLYWQISKSRISVAFNGVNLQQFSPRKNTSELLKNRVNANLPVILYVGRVCQQKGSDLLLDAYADLRAANKDIQLVIAGPIGQFGMSGDATVWLERFHELDATYLGPIEEAELSAVYNTATVFIMPTRTLEMFGMAAVESQACGVPVVASNHGGLIETVPLNCGDRFKVGDSADLAEKIRKLLRNESQYPQLVNNCLANASRFSWDSICSRLEEIHLELKSL